MPYLDDRDPIVRLANTLNDQISDDEQTITIIAALASLLGASLDLVIEDVNAPPELVVLRAMLMQVTSSIVSTRAVLGLRES